MLEKQTKDIQQTQLKMLVDTEVNKKLKEIEQKDEEKKKLMDKVKSDVAKKGKEKAKEAKKKEKKVEMKKKVEKATEKKVEKDKKEKKLQSAALTGPLPPCIVHANPGWPALGNQGGLGVLPPQILSPSPDPKTAAQTAVAPTSVSPA